MDEVLRDKLRAYCTNSLEALQFQLVHDETELGSDGNTFQPDMSHQIFGSSETIFGYKDLLIKLAYAAGSLRCLLNISYTEKVSMEGVQADDIDKALADHLPPSTTRDETAFRKTLSAEGNFAPHGQHIHSYTAAVDGVEKKFSVYHATCETPGFLEYHKRVQSFLLWFVDAASYIDTDDEKWRFYIIYETYKERGSTRYAFVGYLTAYMYYAFPANVRPRISQVLILPPFRRQGHCSALLEAFYNHILVRTDVKDITVEDPSEEFQRVRDFLDASNCLQLPSFAVDKLKTGFSKEMVKEAEEKLKLNKRQTRRVYELLRLRCTDCSNAGEYAAYRQEVKQRLGTPFQRNKRELSKLKKLVDAQELSTTLEEESADQRQKYLNTSFDELTQQYRSVIERIAAS